MAEIGERNGSDVEREGVEDESLYGLQYEYR